MGKKITLRKSGNSLILTMLKSVCQLFNLSEGSEVELEPLTQNSLQLKIV